MQRIRVLILILFVYAYLKSTAQDSHFSQFYNSPLATNPANTGTFAGNYRLTANYKNQWQSISNAYKTIFAGVDLYFPAKNIGAGLTFSSDKAGKSQMGITQGNVLVAYNLKINGSNRFITGIQYGVGQRSLHTDNLKWDSQFNGSTYDPTLASGELNYSDSYTYMDIGACILWNYTANHSHSKFKNSIGIAMYHLNQPKQSYYSNDKLPYKIMATLSSQYELPNSDIYILPQILYAKQGAYTEINAGTLIKFAVGEEGGDLIKVNRVDRRYSTHFAYIGGHWRYKDAFTVMAAFEMRRGLMFSASYDINTSKLRTASQFRGGMELSLIYRGYWGN